LWAPLSYTADIVSYHCVHIAKFSSSSANANPPSLLDENTGSDMRHPVPWPFSFRFEKKEKVLSGLTEYFQSDNLEFATVTDFFRCPLGTSSRFAKFKWIVRCHHDEFNHDFSLQHHG
jgi:hypothetical protein